MDRACRRFATDYDMAVRLPLAGLDSRDRPPADYLASWGRILGEQLPLPNEVIHTTLETS
jgi:hypothetical protein